MKTRFLRKEARKAAKARGHRLGKFSHLMGVGWNSHSIAYCEDCGREVAVYPNPAPNGIDIAGEAVAVNC
jgi:hypothetical protein